MRNEEETRRQLKLILDEQDLITSRPDIIGDTGIDRNTESSNRQEISPNQEVENPPLLSTRRKFLIGSGLVAAGFGLGYLTRFKLSDLEKLFPFSEGQPKNGNMVLGNEETIFRNEMLGYLSYTPDGPITYWTTASGKRRYLLTGGQDNATYMLESDGKRTLKEIMASGEINAQSFKKVYGPDQSVTYKREYAGITSVLQIDKSNPDHLLGIGHGEKRISRDASADFTATVGLAESFDGGLNWQDKGPLIIGTDVKAPGGGEVSGAGQPTAILNQKDGYVYIMYIDWTKSKPGEPLYHKDQLYLARAKANDNGSLGEVEYLTNDGFSSFEPKKLKSVIPVPSDSSFLYTALPHVSWNTELNQFICTGECDTGFWMATSADLLNWSKPEIVYDFTQRGGKPHSILKPGEKWDSYPTALSEKYPTSQITGKNGIFYHSSGDNLTPHEPATLDFEIH